MWPNNWSVIGGIAIAACCMGWRAIQGLFFRSVSGSLIPSDGSADQFTGHGAMIVGLRWLGGAIGLAALAWSYGWTCSRST